MVLILRFSFRYKSYIPGCSTSQPPSMEDKSSNPCQAFNYLQSDKVKLGKKSVWSVYSVQCIFQINITHAVLLVEKGNPTNVRTCYHKDPLTEGVDRDKVNANEVVSGWCGTCKNGAKKNCELRNFITEKCIW